MANSFLFSTQHINFISILFCLLLASCIDPFDKTETERNDPILTVEGLLSTGVGPHKVQLSYTDKYASVFDARIRRINDADVAIRDDLGNVTFLKEAILDSFTFFNPGPSGFLNSFDQVFYPPGWTTYRVDRKLGIYETPVGFAGEVGRTYTLLIILPNGQRYSSIPEKIVKVPEIEDLSYVTEVSPTKNPFLQNSSVRILSKFTDPLEANNYYFWRLSDPVYPYITNPERANPPLDCCNTCFNLYDTKISDVFETMSDFSFNGLTTNQQTVSIVDDGFRFKDRLRVIYHQYSTSESGHRFLRLVKQQLNLEGSVFDPLPANVRGNIFNLEDESIRALGYFFASDVSSKRIYIKKSDLTYLQPSGLVLQSCTEVKGFSKRLSTKEPEDWLE